MANQVAARRGSVQVQLHIPRELAEQISAFTASYKLHLQQHRAQFTHEELRRIMQHMRSTSRGEAVMMAKAMHRDKVVGEFNSKISRHTVILQLLATGLSVSPHSPETFSLKQVLEAIEVEPIQAQHA